MVYLKSRKYQRDLFLQTQRDFALKTLGIHKEFLRLFALNPVCVCEISGIFFVFRYTEVLEPRGIPYIETRNLEGALPDLDILYMTRVQRERFFNEEDYIRLRDSYILTAEKLSLAPADMAVLHPLPRVNEITLDVDDDPRAAYFEQAQNGVYVRMALIMTLLGLKDPKPGRLLLNAEY